MKIRPISAGFKFRKGDVVAVRATIKYDWAVREGSLHLDVDGFYSTVTADSAAVLGLIAPTLEDGDSVNVALDALGVLHTDVDVAAATVMAVRDENAWIETVQTWAGRKHFTVPLVELDPIREPEPQLAAVEEAPAVPPAIIAAPPFTDLDEEITF